jgi:hypothetical protein
MKQNPSVQQAVRSFPKCRDCLFCVKIGSEPCCNRRLKTGPATHPLTGFPRRLSRLRPHCEDERADRDIVAVVKNTCGQRGRFYRAKPIVVIPSSEPKPETNAHEKTTETSPVGGIPA